MSRKPKPILLPETADLKRRFDSTLAALLTVKKTELQQIEAALDAVKKEKARRRAKPSPGTPPR